VKATKSTQVIAKKAKIKFRKCPVAPMQFAILDLESKQKANLYRRRAHGRAFCFFGESSRSPCPGKIPASLENPSIGMKKAKATSKGTNRKPAKKGSTKNKKPKDQAEARKVITDMVRVRSNELAKAVAGEGMKGQLAPVKYLFEVTGLFPKTEETESQPEGDTLAKTLLTHMGFPLIAEESDNACKSGEAAKSELPALKAGASVPQREGVDTGENRGKASEAAEVS
jgi:hypothetical protein